MNHGRTMTQSDGRAHRARKRFGQNFLHDRLVIDRIVDAIDPRPNDHILEVGPGRGALTGRLVASGARLDCVELDRDLATYLRNYYENSGNFTLHQQDILKFDLGGIAGADHGLRVVGNLPYNISTAVLFHLLGSRCLIEDMVFMLQREVVQRLGAVAGGKHYGRLGLMAQYYCEVEHLFNVPSAAFTPRPRVSSAVVRLTPHVTPPLRARDEAALALVIRTAFNQRRKTLKNSLKSIISEDVLAALALDSSLRPENLRLADYVLISNALCESADSDNTEVNL